MAKFQVVKGETSVILTVFILDSSSTTGAGLGSLDQTSSIVGGYVKRDGTGVALAVDENVTTEGTYEAPSTAAQVRIGTPANMTTGIYELHFHNDLFTTADWVTISLSGASNMAPLLIEVQLTDVNLNDGVRGAMTALPNAAADAAGGLVISDAGGLDIDATDTNVSSILTDTGTSGVLLAATATSAQLVDDVWDEVLTGATHNVVNSSGRRLRQIQEAGSYSGGAIYIDTVNGAAGTTNFENGVDSNPVDSIADANTIAASLGISTFVVAAGSSITFVATQADQTFRGDNWTLALGSQSIDGSVIIGATVSGVGTNTSGIQYFIDCNMGTCTIPGDTHIVSSGIGTTTTLGEAGDYFFDRCHSQVAGTGTPVLDFGGALAASNVSMRHYSGGIEIQNMGAGAGSYNMSLEGDGQLVINANCSATSTVAIRGNFTVTDNAGGAVTLSDDARYDVTQINDEVLDVLNVDTITLPGQTAPPLAPTHRQAIGWLYKVLRNRTTQTATQWSLLADDESTVDAKATVSDDATTAIKQEIVTGP